MKVLILRVSEPSHWLSCEKISVNLLKLYKNLGKTKNISIIDFDINYHDLVGDLCPHTPFVKKLNDYLYAEQPDRLIFIDQCPNLYKIIFFIEPFLKTFDLASVFIHVYGDFIYQAEIWNKISKYIIGKKVYFIAASESHQKLINSIMLERDTVKKLCFPIDRSDFFFSVQGRAALREKLNLFENDLVIVYSGRIALQKNVDLLIKEFSKIEDIPNVKIHLWIVGDFDDEGNDIFYPFSFPGSMFGKIQKTLDDLPNNIKKRITLWGHQDKICINEIYNCADIFASLSLYYLEDFGMSPAEALSTGLFAILTDWGGYSSFQSAEWECKLLPVEVTQHGHEVYTKTFHESIKGYIDNKSEFQISRNKRSQSFLKKFEINENTESLFNLLNSKKDSASFKGFNYLLEECKKRFCEKTIDMFRRERINLYYELYQNYTNCTDFSKKDENKVLVNWLDFFLSMSNHYLYSNHLRPDQLDYISNIFPFCNNYYNQLNPILLGLVPNLESAVIPNPLMIRDGYKFLSKFLKEERSNTKFLKYFIHLDFQGHVPKHLQNKVQYFIVKSNQYFSKEDPPQNIFISYPAMNLSFDLSVLKERLDYLAQELGEELIKVVSVSAIIHLSPEKRPFMLPQFCEEMRKCFINPDLKIDFYSLENIQSRKLFKDTLYYEINDGGIIKETFVKEVLLSKGARILKPSEIDNLNNKEERRIDLSLHHQLVIYN